jgi:hypothetical protein
MLFENDTDVIKAQTSTINMPPSLSQYYEHIP